MARDRPRKLEPMPLGAIGGPEDFEELYPEEMMQLGILTAYWSYVEHRLCGLLETMLGDKSQAEAVFYSSSNHKARRDVVHALAQSLAIPEHSKESIDRALEAVGSAADARNKLTHGLFQLDFSKDELIAVHTRPARKVNKITHVNILSEITSAIEKCDKAVGYLGAASMAVTFPSNEDMVAFFENLRQDKKSSTDPA